MPRKCPYCGNPLPDRDDTPSYFCDLCGEEIFSTHYELPEIEAYDDRVSQDTSPRRHSPDRFGTASPLFSSATIPSQTTEPTTIYPSDTIRPSASEPIRPQTFRPPAGSGGETNPPTSQNKSALPIFIGIIVALIVIGVLYTIPGIGVFSPIIGVGVFTVVVKRLAKIMDSKGRK